MPDDDEKVTDCAPGSAAGATSREPLKPYRDRIAEAKEQARAGRVAAGLPADPDDGPWTDAVMATRAKGRRRKR